MTDIIDDWKGDPIAIGTRVLHHVRGSTSVRLKIGRVVHIRRGQDWCGREFFEVRIDVEIAQPFSGTTSGTSRWIGIDNVTVIQ